MLLIAADTNVQTTENIFLKAKFNKTTIAETQIVWLNNAIIIFSFNRHDQTFLLASQFKANENLLKSRLKRNTKIWLWSFSR